MTDCRGSDGFALWQRSGILPDGQTHCFDFDPLGPQVVKSKTADAEDGRGRFKSQASGPARISDRVKKAPLKT